MDLFHVDESVWKKPLELFDRTEKSFEEDVETVREWMKTQPHLPEIMEDGKIRNFLILNKCSVEKTKQKFDMYYTIRGLIPDFYVDSNPKLPHLQENMDVMYCLIHPVLSQEMCRIVIFKMKVPNKCLPRLGAIHAHNINEIRLYEDCMMGEILIFDMQDASVEDVAKFTPTLLSKMYTVYKNVYSIRLKALYFINSFPYIRHVIAFLKLILKPKIFQRIYVCEDSAILNEIFSKETLPKDYGGQGPSLDELNDMLKAKFREHQDRFNLLDKFRVNENLRPEKLNNDELLGFYGNFKKLNVD
ncbi:CRAL TRIO domain containing protein [Asbolus verrucosus]|uniref:CRAL TRIO domain containing protein n=1 Tax=Asbolus verrucosus TaxID=1661398 RepID=A0A482W7F9_ASBVE|nr:CRAL TRIO domain containing protein [Asbolus verrucosus]